MGHYITESSSEVIRHTCGEFYCVSSCIIQWSSIQLSTQSGTKARFSDMTNLPSLLSSLGGLKIFEPQRPKNKNSASCMWLGTSMQKGVIHLYPSGHLITFSPQEEYPVGHFNMSCSLDVHPWGHFITFCSLEAHHRGHFCTFLRRKGNLKGTLPRFSIQSAP